MLKSITDIKKEFEEKFLKKLPIVVEMEIEDWIEQAIKRVGEQEYQRGCNDERKKIEKWAEKNYIDVKGGLQSAGGVPKSWTYYIRLDDLKNKLHFQTNSTNKEVFCKHCLIALVLNLINET